MAVASIALGAGVTWLLSQDQLFVTRLLGVDIPPPLAVAVLAASWIVLVIGVAVPGLAVAASRDRFVATGLVCGWWAFLAVSWTDAVVTRAALPGTPSPLAFWLGTAVALVGGAALIRWTLAPTPTRRPPAPSPVDRPPHEWLPRTDEDPLRR